MEIRDLDKSTARDWVEVQSNSAWHDGEKAGKITAYDAMIREVQDRLAGIDRYMDTRPYSEMLTWLGDQRRALDA